MNIKKFKPSQSVANVGTFMAVYVAALVAATVCGSDTVAFAAGASTALVGEFVSAKVVKKFYPDAAK